MPESRIPSEMLVGDRCEQRGTPFPPYPAATEDDPEIESPLTYWLRLYSRTNIPTSPAFGASSPAMGLREENSIRHALLQTLERLEGSM
jgi:hypothetical protein